MLEAAKAMCREPILTNSTWANLRAAIAREEAKPADFWQSCLDRAQQAEADAKWHREESARLSAELALAKNQMTLAIERSERRLRTAEMELARLRADAFADDCKAILEGKDAKVFTFNGKCSFKFDEPKPVPPFEGDPKACAFKEGAFDPKVGIVRDPVTGWTMDELRGQFDQSRMAVRVLAAELVAARQQIAGTKGFEA